MTSLPLRYLLSFCPCLVLFARNSCAQGSADQQSGVAAGAAVLGGVAGLVVLGPVGAVAGAGALAFAASRDDKVGEVAKSGGEAVVKAANKAKEIDDKHIGAGAAYQVGRCSIAARP